ncbi:hypothetical protein J5N97_004696 [Dioscorea zingiberensis]|uniref:Reverse transcriptase domain-containing protein n=1 Tax=Dioscorea zingiberensis TaxID=325984 RepID=A0A9D5HR79_9LILI|nr:hypothetical protein J5N97_004696 [Dioscorea zingiberensis]
MEKAYDLVSWDTVISVLAHMNFPSKWIRWVKECIGTTSMAFIINEKCGKWVTPQAGLRQGYPLSPYLFILVSQILTNILNKAESMQLLKGFRISDSLGINHILYADDLLICCRASRQNARSIITCMSMYKIITGQRFNMAKSDIYFPSWFNVRVKKAITDILALNQGVFPFKYLGCWISPFKIPVIYFKQLVTKVENKLAYWKTMYLTMAGRVTLANATLMSIPNYCLSTYAIPDSILDAITKLVRKFIWANNSDGHGLHLIGWEVVTNPKSEGGLGIKNLKVMKKAILSKHVLELLNDGEKTWIKLMKSKYGPSKPWLTTPIRKVSWTYRGLLQTARSIKSNVIQSNIINSNSVLQDPWLFDIPLNLMPTYFNIDYDMSNLSIENLRTNSQWNWDYVNIMFHPYMVDLIFEKQVDEDHNKVKWKWKNKTEGKSLTAAVYDEYRFKDLAIPWNGWKKIWKLRVIPKIKLFLWKFFHGRLPTIHYLSSIGIGLTDLCPLCKLFPETANHLFF